MSIAELKGYVLGMCLFVALAGCSGTVGSTPAPPGSGPTATPPPSNPIQHVVVLVQENRSFNNLFAGFPGADTAMKGLCKPAPHATWCKTQREVPLKSITLEKGTGVFRGTDICHSHGCFEIECDANASNVCQMDGFDLIAIGETSNGRPAKLFRTPTSIAPKRNRTGIWHVNTLWPTRCSSRKRPRVSSRIKC